MSTTSRQIDAFDAFQRRAYFPELDGLRALCVMLVVTVHLYSHKDWWAWLAGHRGVGVFFVVSGFLITALALREERDHGRLALGPFLLRRAFRLFPLYYLVLAVYVAYFLMLGRGTDEQRLALGEAMPGYLLYCQEWPFFRLLVVEQRDLPFFQTWSLGVEEKFYLLWPPLAFVLWRARPRWRLTGTVALVLAFAATAGLSALGPTGHLTARYLSGYYSILVGCLLAVLMHEPRGHAALCRLAERGGGWPALGLFAAAHFLTPHAAGVGLSLLDLAYPLAAAAVLVPLSAGRGPAAGVLRWGPLAFVGRLSYAVYLVHLLVMAAVYRALPIAQGPAVGSVAAVALAGAGSVAAAYVLHRAVERPCVRLGRSLAARWTPVPAAA